MKIDKPTKHRNMQLKEADLDQLAVFNELIADSLEEIVSSKTVQIYSRDANGTVVVSPNDKGELVPILEDFTHTAILLRKNVADYNKYRKAKKEFVKSLETKRAK